MLTTVFKRIYEKYKVFQQQESPVSGLRKHSEILRISLHDALLETWFAQKP